MSRLRFQCLAASVGLHGVLLMVLVAGAGFVVPREEQTLTLPVLEFIPDRLVDAPVVGGGDPRGTPRTQPAPAPPVADPTPPAPLPRVTPAPVPRATPAAPKPRPKPAADSNAYTDGSKKAPKKPKIQVNKNPVVRDRSTPRAPSAAEREAAAAAEAAEAARSREEARVARNQQIGGAVSALKSGLSSRSLSVVPFGPGGGGETYAGYGLYVRMIFDRAWRAPAEVPEGSAVVTVRVVIARDGSVVQKTVTRRSGIAVLDRSVQAALDRVTTIGRPFPENSPDDQKTFLIDFDLKTKQGLG
ncbi:MAG TPA: TonB C-terminal domain-containing protein [Verrucomicrobiota bacterium]|nr:TonB C-terminal domain-containing protein [Verrucomicrobiota bacterium]HNU52126.1 TonB C-terminal domain-containing protein [Verrucomicrobiota bacterium]